VQPGNEFFEPQQQYHPYPHPYPPPPPVQATMHHQYHREGIKWSALAPYLVACAAVAVATATLFLFLSWKGSMQAQVTQLRHEVATAQVQAASGDAGLSQSLSGLARHVSTLRTDVNAISGLVSSYTGICTIDAAGPSGVSSYAVHCKG